MKYITQEIIDKLFQENLCISRHRFRFSLTIQIPTGLIIQFQLLAIVVVAALIRRYDP